MASLSHQEITALLLALGVLLAGARVLGELARHFNQPAVLGEIVAGILLGPTVLGQLAPKFSAFLFPAAGGGALALDGLMTLAITLFLLVAGMEVDLSTVWRQGRLALVVGLAGILIPFALGLGGAWYFPDLMGGDAGGDQLIFALFIATALSISALPVIARTLMDLNLYRSDLGMTIIAAAVFNDLVGWIVFAVILGLIGVGGASAGIAATIGMTLGFAVFMLTLGRALIHRIIPWIHAHASWPGGVLGFAMVLALVCSAFTEWVGVHAIFGSFLAGVALGDSGHLRQRTRATIAQFVSFIFAPLFFAGIGLRVNFIAHFDLGLVLLILVIACLGKVVGCGLGGRLAGMSVRESWALGFGMNARGAMEIILGLLALEYGLIGEPLFVALVVMALVTSLMSGPAMQRILRLKKPRCVVRYLRPKAYLPALKATGRQEAIVELSRALALSAGLDPVTVTEAVLAREALMPTGIGRGIAVPHARLDGLAGPLAGVGISRVGIDFDAPDGCPAMLLFLLLTPKQDDGVQVELLADIARTFRQRDTFEQSLQAKGFTEFIGLLKSNDE
ncbi:cation:proton antiporter domain-containing protein [Trichloromonas sp.]|uniref:cation:proton antiporter domain-containing protein n=1 Tax=Trichloromonas sp. TaxID=3069249 RepID=UPI003D8155F0